MLHDIVDVRRFRINGSYEQLVDHSLLAPSAAVMTAAFRSIWQMPWSAIFLMLTAALLLKAAALQPRFALLALPALIPFAWSN